MRVGGWGWGRGKREKERGKGKEGLRLLRFALVVSLDAAAESGESGAVVLRDAPLDRGALGFVFSLLRGEEGLVCGEKWG